MSSKYSKLLAQCWQEVSVGCTSHWEAVYTADCALAQEEHLLSHKFAAFKLALPEDRSELTQLFPLLKPQV
jgi:hypothetical protein